MTYTLIWSQQNSLTEYIRIYQKQQWGCVDTQNWHDSDFLDDLDRLVRPLVQTGQTGQEKFVKLSIRLHHCIDLVETIKIHMWNVQFGVRMRKLCLPEDLTGQTGPKRTIRVRSYILVRDLLEFRLVQTSPPYIYMKGHGRLRVFPIESINNHITYFLSLKLQPLPNSNCCSSHISTAFEGILSGLPTSEQLQIHELRRGPFQAR